MASGMLLQNSGALRRGLKHHNFHRHVILLMVGGHRGDRFPGSVFGELDHFLVHLPLPRVQRGYLHFGLGGVHGVDRLGVVPQGLLRESEGIAAPACSFRPGVAVGMKGDPVDAKALTTLVKLGGAVLGWDLAEIEEERP